MTKNPFTPLAGQVPLRVAGREAFLQEMEYAFAGEASNPYLSTLIIGPRGTGKTVLLSQIARIAQREGWIVAQVPAFEGMLEDILQRTYEAGSHILEKSDKRVLSGIELAGVLGASWQQVDSGENWRSRMNHVFDQLAETNTGLLITVDELNITSSDMVTLAMAHQHFISEGRRVSLVMAGLPGNVSGLLNGKTTSFWRRAHHEHLGRIDDASVDKVLKDTLADASIPYDEAALRVGVENIGGFAYLIQLVGYWSYESMRREGAPCLCAEHIKAGVEKARLSMRSNVLSSTYAELSDGDIKFLMAMLRTQGPSTMRDIAEEMGVSQGYASQYRLRLITQGVIGPRGRGKLDFEIPFFREYVQEMTGLMPWPDEVAAGDVTRDKWEDALRFDQAVRAEGLLAGQVVKAEGSQSALVVRTEGLR